MIESMTWNIRTIIIIECLGIVSSILFIYILYKFFAIKLSLNMMNIMIIIVGLIVLIVVNINQYEKIHKYTISSKSISSYINEESFNFKTLKKDVNDKIVEHHDADKEYDSYYMPKGIESYVRFVSKDCEAIYAIEISMLKISIEDLNKSNANRTYKWLKEDFQTPLKNCIETNKIIETVIVFNIIATIFETILFIYCSGRNTKNNKK